MKKAHLLIHNFFSEFEWYRQYKGGKWYLVYEREGCNTFDGANQYWTQVPGGNAEIIKEVIY